MERIHMNPVKGSVSVLFGGGLPAWPGQVITPVGLLVTHPATAGHSSLLSKAAEFLRSETLHYRLTNAQVATYAHNVYSYA